MGESEPLGQDTLANESGMTNRNMRFYVESLQTFADMARDKDLSRLPGDSAVTFEVDLIRQLIGTIDVLGAEYLGRDISTDLKQRHEELHHGLDELLACYFVQTKRLISNTPLMDFLKWSHLMTENPSCEAHGGEDSGVAPRSTDGS